MNKQCIILVLALIVMTFGVYARCGVSNMTGYAFDLNETGSNMIVGNNDETWTLNESCQMNVSIQLGGVNVTFDGAGNTLWGNYSISGACAYLTNCTNNWNQMPNVAIWTDAIANLTIQNINIYNYSAAIYLPPSGSGVFDNALVQNIDTNSYIYLNGRNNTLLTNITMHDTILTQNTSSNIMTLVSTGSMNNVTVQKSRFLNIGYPNVYTQPFANNNSETALNILLASGANLAVVTVKNDYFENVTGTAIASGSNLSNVSIVNNTFMNTLGINTVNGYFGYNTIQGFSPSKLFCQGVALTTQSAYPFVAEYNNISDCDRGLRLRANRSNTNFHHNNIETRSHNYSWHNQTAYGIYMQSPVGMNNIFNNNNVYANLTQNTYAIQVDSGAINNTIYRNTLFFGTINATDYRNTIENNTFALGAVDTLAPHFKIYPEIVSRDTANFTWTIPTSFVPSRYYVDIFDPHLLIWVNQINTTVNTSLLNISTINTTMFVNFNPLTADFYASYWYYNGTAYVLYSLNVNTRVYAQDSTGAFSEKRYGAFFNRNRTLEDVHFYSYYDSLINPENNKLIFYDRFARSILSQSLNLMGYIGRDELNGNLWSQSGAGCGNVSLINVGSTGGSSGALGVSISNTIGSCSLTNSFQNTGGMSLEYIPDNLLYESMRGSNMTVSVKGIDNLSLTEGYNGVSVRLNNALVMSSSWEGVGFVNISTWGSYSLNNSVTGRNTRRALKFINTGIGQSLVNLQMGTYNRTFTIAQNINASSVEINTQSNATSALFYSIPVIAVNDFENASEIPAVSTPGLNLSFVPHTGSKDVDLVLSGAVLDNGSNLTTVIWNISVDSVLNLSGNISGTNTTLTLATINHTQLIPGQNWSAVAYATNGVENSTLQTDWVVIFNTAPSLATDITPHLAYTGSNLTLTAAVSDNESDLVTVYYDVYLDGVLNFSGNASGINTTLTYATISGSQVMKGQNWTSSVYATDGYNASGIQNYTVIIGDTAPTLSISLAPQPTARDDQDITLSYIAGDIDGDNVSIDYIIYRNGVVYLNTVVTVVPGSGVIDTIPASVTSPSDVWWFNATGSDGTLPTLEQESQHTSIASVVQPSEFRGMLAETGYGIGEFSNGSTANGGFTRMLLGLGIVFAIISIVYVVVFVINKAVMRSHSQK
jgi:hypothetical protein